MLSELGGIVGIDDPHLGHHLGVWRPIPLAWATAADEPELATLIDLQRDHDDFFFNDRYAAVWEPALRDLILARFRAQASERVPGARALVVKEPGSQAAELLSRLFSSSALIFLLRDARDVVASWLDAYRSGSWAEPRGAFPASRRGRVPLARWLASVWLYRTEAVERAASSHGGPTVTVRYERLRADPAAELARITAAIGVDAGPDEIAAAASIHDLEQVAPSRRGRGKEIRAGRPGGWARELSGAERKAVLAVAGRKLVELGYAEPADLAEGQARAA
jgi:Sulfotransferase family